MHCVAPSRPDAESQSLALPSGRCASRKRSCLIRTGRAPTTCGTPLTPAPLVAGPSHVRLLKTQFSTRAAANVGSTAPMQPAPPGNSSTGLWLQKLLGMGTWKEALTAIAPPANLSQKSEGAITAVQSCLAAGTAVLVGSAATGLAVHNYDIDIVVTFPDFSLQTYAAALQAIASNLKGAKGQSSGFDNVQLGDLSVQCCWQGMNLDILVGCSEPIGPLTFLDPKLTAHQRQTLSASTAVATSAFLAQQPSLFKVSVRLIKHWARVVHGKDWDDKSRPKSYLLVLLGLEAYQQYLATAAAHNLSTPASTATPIAYAASSISNHDKAVAVEFIFITFLKLAATLSPNTLLCWDMLYGCKVVPQVLACPGFSEILRPKGCESHPLVLDLGDPVNNVAAAVPALDRLKQLAVADLRLVEDDTIMQLQQQVQQLQLEQKARAAENASNAAAVAALILHQQIVCKNQPPTSSSGYTWKFDMPVAAWLPDGKKFSDIGTISRAQGLRVEVSSVPLKSEGDKVQAGLHLKLGSSDVPSMQKLRELQLPIPITVLSGTTVTLVANKGSSYRDSYYDGRTYKLDADSHGVLQGAQNGHTLYFEHGALAKLQLVSGYNSSFKSDLQVLKERAQGYMLKVSLQFQVGT